MKISARKRKDRVVIGLASGSEVTESSVTEAKSRSKSPKEVIFVLSCTSMIGLSCPILTPKVVNRSTSRILKI